MTLLPPPGQRKIATSWLAIAVVVLMYVHAVVSGAPPKEALDTATGAIVWICGLVFGANAGVHLQRNAARKPE